MPAQCQTVCRVVLGEKEKKQFIKAIDQDYRVHWSVRVCVCVLGWLVTYICICIFIYEYIYIYMYYICVCLWEGYRLFYC